MPYILKIEGQDIPLTNEVAATDQTIRNALTPFYPETATAEIKREVVNGVTQIKILKKAGTKGTLNLIQKLKNNQQELNPALVLSLQIKELEIKKSLNIETLVILQSDINNALNVGEEWKNELEKSLKLLKCCIAASCQLPLSGF